MPTVDYDLIRVKVFEYINEPELKAKMKELGATGLNPFKLNNVGKPVGFSDTLLKAEGFAGDLFHYLIWAVEKVCHDFGDIASGKGADKKKVLVQLIDESIKLPFFFESFDDNIIEWLIDKAVEFLNKKFGKDWVVHIPEPTLVKPQFSFAYVPPGKAGKKDKTTNA